ncbi:MAG: hypothetical protein AAFV97_03975 [Bacteroidota bacterium]
MEEQRMAGISAYRIDKGLDVTVQFAGCLIRAYIFAKNMPSGKSHAAMGKHMAK